jgi:maltose/moltooligosaccharide transporter
MKQKPNLTFWQLWNLSFAYLGIQIGYSLQGTQMSGIFSALGAPDANLTILWLGGPLAGILVQPIIGLFSDKTWVKGLGRRIPFLLAGGILATLMMVLIVNTKVFADNLMPGIMVGALPVSVMLAAVFFLLKDCAFNASMHPLRALQGDIVNEEQRDKGFGVQMVLLNIGQIVGFALPFMFAWFVDKYNMGSKEVGGISFSLSLSYYVGAAILILGVLWTTFRVKEYPPKEYAEYNGISEEVAQKKESFWQILKTTPTVMYQLAIVQFFVWSAMFLIWNYGLNGTAENIFGIERIDGKINTADVNWDAAVGWWGICNAVMAVFALGFSFIFPTLTNKFGRKPIYAITLMLCGIGFASIFMITNKYMLFLPMAGWGIATAVFNAIPFAIVCAKVPKEKMGAYMGIFNLTLVIPQICMSILGVIIFKYVVGDTGSNVMMLVVVGILFMLASLAVSFVKDNKEVETPAL